MDIKPMRWAGDPEFSGQRASVDYLSALRAAQHDPQQLEALYDQARQEHQAARFTDAIVTCHQESPDNLLYAAWFYRLRTPAQAERPAGLWWLAVPLGLLTGLILWLLSGERLQFGDDMPYLVLLWSPIAAVVVLGFLAAATRQHYQRAALLAGSLLALSAYVVYMSRRTGFDGQESYLELMIPHLPLISVSAVGFFLLGLRSRPHERFAFLTKSIEVLGTGGIYAAAVGIFTAITYGLFEALGIELPEAVMRLLLVGGLGTLPLLAIASTYDPRRSPQAQEFRRGIGKSITMMMWLLLPVTLVVLVVYLGVIPFRFMQPFRERDVLIVYNVMLFAIIGLCLGATPITADELARPQQRMLRGVMLAVAGLTLLISLYALAALVYRTLDGGLTVNRLAVIGWNMINLGLLGALIGGQLRRRPDHWVEALQTVFGKAALWYAGWACLLAITIPWFF